jgi:uncharacterized phage protein gp47/JayE
MESNGDYLAMPLNFPANRNEVNQRIKTDVQNSLSSSNPFLSASFLGAIVAGLAGRIFDIYYQIKNVLMPNLFVNTAENSMLEQFGEIWGIARNPATQASGLIACTGIAGTLIPLGTTWQNSAGITFESLASISVAVQSISISGITRSGAIATATTASNHNLATGMSVVIAGADQAEYNGTFTITVLSANSFSYSSGIDPITPATGAISASYTAASVSVKSQDFGQQANMDAGEGLTITTPISGLDNAAIVQFTAIAEGTDIESDDDFRARILFKIQNPTAQFSATAIEAKAKEVSGVTRVWVEEATPIAGKVSIYFTRDNDLTIIPSAGEITEVKEKVLTIKPAHTPDAYVLVLAPSALSVDFSFSAISPDTDTMKAAIIANIEQFFLEQVNVGEIILEDAYRAIIYNTTDTETGDKLLSFTLTTPSGNISIAAGELGTLGTITFI